MQRGFTILEALIAVAIMGIILGLSVPSMVEFMQRKRIEAVVEEFYTKVKYAQSESIKRQIPIFVSIKGGANWCYGLDDVAACDCLVADSCEYNSVEYVVRASDSKIDSLTPTVFPVSGTVSYIQFDGIRGGAVSSGNITIVNGPYSVTTTLNTAAKIDNCSNSLGTYPSCI